MKREAELKGLFVAELRRQLPGFILLQYATAGAPDREVIGQGRTSRWEFKHATPHFDSPGLQELTCTRLASAGHCRYIIWCESPQGNQQRTMIVGPSQLWSRRKEAQQGAVDARSLIPEAWCSGYNMAWLVEQVRKVHTSL